MSIVIKALFLFILFFNSSFIFSEDDYAYLLKSMAWKKISRNLYDTKPNSANQAFALYRLYEENNEKEKTRSTLLYFIITNSHVQEVDSKSVLFLKNLNLKDSKTLTKLAFYKLVKDLKKQSLISNLEKYELLQKIPIEQDPTSIHAFQESISSLIEMGENFIIQKKYDSLTEEEKNFILNHESRYQIAKSYYKSGKSEEARKILIHIFHSRELNSDMKKKSIELYKQIIGEDKQSFPVDDLIYLVNHLPLKEQKEIYQLKLLPPNLKVSTRTLFRNLCIYYLNNSVPFLSPFLNLNQEFSKKEEDIILNLVENLVNKKEFTLAEDYLNLYLKNSSNQNYFKLKYRLAKRYDNFDKTFSSLIEYLKNNPYDVRLYDTLIETLANSDSNSVSYQQEEYWVRAIETLPNLAIKGRLIYWYLRYLRYKGDFEKLKIMLSNYYTFCPGSYYTMVIHEEFQQEISSLPQVESFGTKENLFKFISGKNYLEYAIKLSNQNLSYAYFKDSYELGQKLNSMKSKIESSKLLLTAVEYLKLGEQDKGSYLLEAYFLKNKSSELEKFEIYVGVGDLSKNHYLSLFYTRQLMKHFKIPDDPLLLPYSIYSRLYPRPHREIVLENTKEFGIDENIVYAVMRQESFFRENAISSSNARGLMQVMPATGRLIAKKLKVTDYSLHDPEVSIKFGTKFLTDLMDSYGNLKWASIAYNGGPGNLRKWKRRHYKNDFNHFLEELPTKESRDYCRIIISNFINYKVLQIIEKN